MAYENIKVEKRGNIGIITINRPKALNALNHQTIEEILDAMRGYDREAKISCMVLTGNEKAFAAGADIKEMQDRGYVENYIDDFFANVAKVSEIRKPIIAAVAGYALGGGCELAMLCDFIVAADNAKFGQPEINLGVMPGWGGSQRLTRFVGKSKAMDMCLTGRTMNAQEAERSGLVSRIFELDDLMEETLKIASKIADFSQASIMMNKEAVNRSYEMTLNEGVRFERRLFHSLFATNDQKEGMAAFIEKRKPQFNNN